MTPHEKGPRVKAWEGAPGQRGPVDASGQWRGDSFRDIVGLKKLLLTQEEQVARQLAARLLAYGTGR
ncbi:MAG: hypothetical protein CMM26_01990 [Rhodospirillaceae bacterium]|nr:hypothetical protein [Rhodospirillaceae bacterium]